MRPMLSIDKRLPDFDRTRDLAARLANLKGVLAGQEGHYADVFWDHYAASEAVAGRWTRAQVDLLRTRTARYFSLRSTEPLTQRWTDDALELANSAFDADIAITVVLAALSAVHSEIRSQLFGCFASEPQRLLNALDASDRLNILEAEILTTQIHQLSEAKVAAERKEVVKKFEGEIISVVRTLLAKATSSQQSAEDVRMSMEIVSGLSSELRRELKEHSTNVLAVSTATDQLVGSLGMIRHEVANINQALILSGDAVMSSDKAYQNLSEQSKNAAGIIKVIRAILENSEILSLNAQIEAARGGDDNKAFAVIAGEMRDLVSQTREAVVRIGDQISAMNAATNEVLESAEQIRSSVKATQNASEGVSAMANDQERALSDLNFRMRSVSRIAENVAERFTAVDEQVALISDAATDGHLEKPLAFEALT